MFLPLLGWRGFQCRSVKTFRRRAVMQVRKLCRTELLAAAVAPAALLVLGSVAHAQTPYYPVNGNVATINTFDTAASFSTVVNYNPPPMIARFDYGAVTPSGAANHSVTWS